MQVSCLHYYHDRNGDQRFCYGFKDYVLIGDFNGDFIPDLLCHRDTGGRVAIWPGAGDGTFPKMVWYVNYVQTISKSA